MYRTAGIATASRTEQDQMRSLGCVSVTKSVAVDNPAVSLIMPASAAYWDLYKRGCFLSHFHCFSIFRKIEMARVS